MDYPKLTKQHIIARANGGTEILFICDACNSGLNKTVQIEFSQMSKQDIVSRSYETDINGVVYTVTSTVVGTGSIYFPSIVQIQGSGNHAPAIWRNFESWFSISGTSTFSVVAIMKQN